MTNEKGFTLIEIMIAVVIMAILATVVTPRFRDLIAKSKETKLKENLNIIRSAIDVEFTKRNGKNPEQITTGMFKEGNIPSDPIKDSIMVIYTEDDPILVSSNDGGWIYNPSLGEVRVNNIDNDITGIPYSTY